MVIENYMPDFAVEAVYDLTVPSLQAQGIKAVLVDLDNTLIAWNNPDGTPEMKQWLHDLRDAGIRIIVVSNNTKKRVQRAVEKFGIDYVYWALKPFTFGIDRAMKEFHYEKSEVVMVGDQLMTDIRAAHRAGIRSILVNPLVQHDSIKTQINRARERRVMRKITEKYGPITYKKGISGFHHLFLSLLSQKSPVSVAKATETFTTVGNIFLASLRLASYLSS